MIQKTVGEKQALKAAKKSWKQELKAISHEISGDDEPFFKQHGQHGPQPEIITTGIVEGEEPLPDDYPVYFGHLYVVSDKGGKVIVSDIEGTVKTLKADLRKLGYEAEVIRNCKLFERNLI